ERAGDDARAHGGGDERRHHRAVAVGPKHDARRRVRALHRARAARRAAGSQPHGPAGVHGSATVERGSGFKVQGSRSRSWFRFRFSFGFEREREREPGTRTRTLNPEPRTQTRFIAMGRAWAIIERELRRFRRSPILIAMSMTFPIVQLLVLGYAFGGNVKHLKVAIVDQDHGVPAVKVRELASAIASGARTIDL